MILSLLLVFLSGAIAAGPTPSSAGASPTSPPVAPTVLTPGPAAAPTAAEAETLRGDIRRLLELTGAVAITSQMLDQMVTGMRASLPNVPGEVWVEVRAEMHAESLVEATVAIYERHFTQTEITALLSFYASPVGQKLIAEQPAIVSESMAVGQEWGVQASQRAMARLKAKGVVF